MPNFRDFSTTPIILRIGEYEFSPCPLVGQSFSNIKIGENRSHVEATYTFSSSLIDDIGSGISTLYPRKTELYNAISGSSTFVIKYGPGGLYPSGTILESGVGYVDNLQFSEGTWTTRLEYTFDLNFLKDFNIETSGVVDVSESWSFEEPDDNIDIIEVTHNLSARGINTSGVPDSSLINAKNFVLGRITTGVFPAFPTIPGFVEGSGSSYYESVRGETVDFFTKTYSITQKFTRSSGAYDHRFTSTAQVDKNGIVTLGLNGRIRGFGRKSDAITRATSGWNAFVRRNLPYIASGQYNDLGYSGILNTSGAESLSITRNLDLGTIEYGISYNDDPTNNLPSGVAEANFEKTISPALRQFVVFGIPRSLSGPTVQDIGTNLEETITINGSVTATQDSDIYNIKSYAQTRFNALRPNPNDYNYLFMSSRSETTNEDAGTFNATISWSATKNLASSPDPSGSITFV